VEPCREAKGFFEGAVKILAFTDVHNLLSDTRCRQNARYRRLRDAARARTVSLKSRVKGGRSLFRFMAGFAKSIVVDDISHSRIIGSRQFVRDVGEQSAMASSSRTCSGAKGRGDVLVVSLGCRLDSGFKAGFDLLRRATVERQE
jgi:hypothetical protein